MTFRFKFSDGVECDAVVFAKAGDVEFYWIHDAAEIFDIKFIDFLRSSIFKNINFIVSFSWFQDEFSIQNLRDYLLGFEDRFILIFNSFREVECARKILSDFNVLHFNNSNTIDLNIFKYFQKEINYDLVVNAKPLRFKNHYLSSSVNNKAFIAYDVSMNSSGDSLFDTVDLTQFSPTRIFNNITPQEVADVLSVSCFGGIFSAVEGGCYASLEYLLCGLPVVSTSSEGGREDFYNSTNSFIINDKEDVIDVISQNMNTFSMPDLRADIAKSARNAVLLNRQLFTNDLSRLISSASKKFNFKLIESYVFNENKVMNVRNQFPSKFIF